MTPGAAWSTRGQGCGEKPLAMPGEGGTLPERQVPGGCGEGKTCPCRKLNGPKARRGLGGSMGLPCLGLLPRSGLLSPHSRLVLFGSQFVDFLLFFFG